MREMNTAPQLDAVKKRLAKSPTVKKIWAKISPPVLPNLIFVLGSQRSGTNVLRQSLSLDPWTQGFNERRKSELYIGWALRPEPEIRDYLYKCQGNTVLLKPIQSVIRRPVAEFLSEFDDYNLKVAWIYRDPVAVFRSRGERWSYKAEAGPFIEEWNRINKSAMDANDPRIAVVCYDQLASDPKVFHALCAFLGIRGENLFNAGRSVEEVESALSAEDVAEIRKATSEQLARLEAAAAKLLDSYRESAAGDEEGDGPDPSKKLAAPSTTG
jgi:hypothetical protein